MCQDRLCAMHVLLMLNTDLAGESSFQLIASRLMESENSSTWLTLGSGDG